jgi:hypothetical protein
MSANRGGAASALPFAECGARVEAGRSCVCIGNVDRGGSVLTPRGRGSRVSQRMDRGSDAGRVLARDGHDAAVGSLAADLVMRPP